MKQWIRSLLLRWERKLRVANPPQDLAPVVRELGERLIEERQRREPERLDYVERCHELMEATQMQGSGPWKPSANEGLGKRSSFLRLIGVRETELPRLMESFSNVGAQGAMGDLELALQNVEWRREVNFSFLEFSRWGIQQIILISRLYYTKNPIIRRLLNVDAYYVFGRGFEVSCDNEAVQSAIEDYAEANKVTLGQNALSEHQKRTNYDGNLFFRFFPDTNNTGSAEIRLVDATEIQDIITNPEDITEEWYFRRTWVRRDFDGQSGQTTTKTEEAWYPAIGYQPKTGDKLDNINGIKVDWLTPVMHEKYGAVGQWLFGCPIIYPALDWAKAARRYLEACMTLAQSLAQFSMSITTKGGQQALAGVKQQLATTVGPTTQVFETNPTAVNASIFASGPGTALQAFHSRGQGLDPSEVKQIAAMCAICMDVPPTFLGDLETANLATATSLDRPTELAFMHKQERWREVLCGIYTYALNVQLRAPNGKLREALASKFGDDIGKVRFTEAPRRRLESSLPGKPVYVYLTEAERKAAGKPKKETDMEIKVSFPAIREGDIPQLITALVEAMTLGNKGGQVVGIDEKEGVRALGKTAGLDNWDEVVETMYPEKGTKDNPAYDPSRTAIDDSNPQMPIATRPPYSQGGPQAPGGHPQPAPKQPTPGQEALYRRWSSKLLRMAEKRSAA